MTNPNGLPEDTIPLVAEHYYRHDIEAIEKVSSSYEKLGELAATSGKLQRMFNTISSVTLTTNSYVDEPYIAGEIRHMFNEPVEHEMTINFDEQPSAELMAALLGLRVVVLPKLMACPYAYAVPKRTHRKFRIRKKWAKRYGYRIIYGPEEPGYIKRDAVNGDCVYVGPDGYSKILKYKEELGIGKNEMD